MYRLACPSADAPIAYPLQYDQDELLAELEELEQLELDEQLLNMESVPASKLPNVPTTARMLAAPAIAVNIGMP